MIFRMFLAFLIFEENWPFWKGYSLCTGYSLWKKACFKDGLISRIFGVIFERFFAQNNSHDLVELFGRFSQSSHFSNIWCFFERVFAQKNCNDLSCWKVFLMFFAFLVFDPNWPFCKGYSLCMGYSLCKKANFQNHRFSAFWLRSSEVSVLFALTKG